MQVGPIHQRSPVVLDGQAEWETWLEGDEGEVMVFEESIDRPDLVPKKVVSCARKPVRPIVVFRAIRALTVTRAVTGRTRLSARWLPKRSDFDN